MDSHEMITRKGLNQKDCNLEEFVESYISKIVQISKYRVSNNSTTLLEVRKAHTRDSVTDVIDDMILLICSAVESEGITTRKCSFPPPIGQSLNFTPGVESANLKHKPQSICTTKLEIPMRGSNGHVFQITDEFLEGTSDKIASTMLHNSYNNSNDCLINESQLQDRLMFSTSKGVQYSGSKLDEPTQGGDTSESHEINIIETKNSECKLLITTNNALNESITDKHFILEQPSSHDCEILTTRSECPIRADTGIFIKTDKVTFDDVSPISQQHIYQNTCTIEPEGISDNVTPGHSIHKDESINMALTDNEYTRNKSSQLPHLHVDNSHRKGASPVAKHGPREDGGSINELINPTEDGTTTLSSSANCTALALIHEMGALDSDTPRPLGKEREISNSFLQNNAIHTIAQQARAIVSDVLLRAVGAFQPNTIINDKRELEEDVSEDMEHEESCTCIPHEASDNMTPLEMCKKPIASHPKEMATTQNPLEIVGLINSNSVFPDVSQKNNVQQVWSASLLSSPNFTTEEIVYPQRTSKKEHNVQFASPLEIRHEYTADDTISEADTLELIESQDISEVNIYQESVYDDSKFIVLNPKLQKSQPWSTGNSIGQSNLHQHSKKQDYFIQESIEKDVNFTTDIMSPLLEKYDLNKEGEIQYLMTKRNEEKTEQKNNTAGLDFQGESDMICQGVSTRNSNEEQQPEKSPSFPTVFTDVKSLSNSQVDHLYYKDIGFIDREGLSSMEQPKEECPSMRYSEEKAYFDDDFDKASLCNDLCNIHQIEKRIAIIETCEDACVTNKDQYNETYHKRKHQELSSDIAPASKCTKHDKLTEEANIHDSEECRCLSVEETNSDQTVPCQPVDDKLSPGPDVPCPENGQLSIYLDSMLTEKEDYGQLSSQITEHRNESTSEDDQKCPDANSYIPESLPSFYSTQRPVNLFGWKPVNSDNVLESTGEHSDDMALKPLPRLPTCHKPRRVGLSRRQSVKPLHLVCRSKSVFEKEQ